FFMGRPDIDQLLLQVIVDGQVRIESMKNGESDWITDLTSEQASAFMNNPDFTTFPVESNGWIITLFNVADPSQPMPARDDSGNLVDQPQHPVLGDPRVRQALVEGWDHEDAVFLVGEGARRLVGPVAPILSDIYDNDLQLYPYDPAAAAALLDEAGWVLNGDVREKDGVPMKIELAYLTDFQDVAAVIADYWRKLGVDVTLTTGEQGAILGEHIFPQAFDAFIVSVTWAEPTPDVMINFLWNSTNDMGSNFGSFINEELDGLMGQLATADCSAQARQPMYYRIQEILHEQVPTDFISTVVNYTVTSSRISNVQFSTWGSNPIWEWQVSD
ncbi:MAG: hypothetical protein K8I60_12290, partial [Anaerolineae bacterium]|nr:hypothetical protein [Anaerolineae bacterium]